MGNLAELIIAGLALRAGLVELVKASITGSILGNLLLVLGAALFAGGCKFKVQRFNPHLAVQRPVSGLSFGPGAALANTSPGPGRVATQQILLRRGATVSVTSFAALFAAYSPLAFLLGAGCDLRCLTGRQNITDHPYKIGGRGVVRRFSFSVTEEAVEVWASRSFSCASFWSDHRDSAQHSSRFDAMKTDGLAITVAVGSSIQVLC